MSEPAPAVESRQAAQVVAVGCGVTLLVFGAYELLEVAWLASMLAPSELRWLHIARGLMSTAIVAWVVAVLVLRRPPTPFAPLEAPRESEEEAGRRRVEWFIRLRWLAIVGVGMLSILATQVSGLLAPEAFPPLLSCVALLVAANALHTIVARRGRNWERQLRLQMTVDVALLTAMLHYAGGVENPFYPIYLFHVIIAAILFGPRSARRFAFGSWALFFAVSMAEATGWLTGPACGWALRVASPELVAIRLVPLLGVLLLTAYLTSVIMEQLRWREAQWADAARNAAAERAKLESVVRAAGLGLMLVDPELEIVWSNDRAREWFGEDGAGTGRTCAICKTGEAAEGFS